MAPKGEPGCRRHRSVSEGEPLHGVDGIRRPRIAFRRQGGVGLQQPERPPALATACRWSPMLKMRCS